MIVLQDIERTTGAHEGTTEVHYHGTRVGVAYAPDGDRRQWGWALAGGRLNGRSDSHDDAVLDMVYHWAIRAPKVIEAAS